MAIRRVRAPRIDFTALRRELKLPDDFPPDAQREADQATGTPPAPPADRTDLPFVTIDPATSRDLDQAMCLQRRAGGGYRVYYAIADVSSFVRPGGALEAETWRRGQTVYLPDAKVPLHPTSLSEGTASLLPDSDRLAVLWTIDLDADGDTVDVHLERARVRSRAKLDYAGVQSDVDAGRAAEPIALLPEIGRLLTDRGVARGAINLRMPDQEVEQDTSGRASGAGGSSGRASGAGGSSGRASGAGGNSGWRLWLRAPAPVEEYNAQISLLTGVCAAKIMLGGGVGLLRTMPAARPDAVERLGVAARGLHIDWPAGASVGSVVATVDPADPHGAAFLDQTAELMRGAGYTAFDGSPPEHPEHGAVGGPYAHVTAPLRRLADRYATEVCLALAGSGAVPDWVREALPKLPEVMERTDHVANAAERGAVDLVEAVVLAGRVGEEFEATVVDADGRRGTIMLNEPPVRARCEGENLPLGEQIRVRLVEADPVQRRTLFKEVDR